MTAITKKRFASIGDSEMDSCDLHIVDKDGNLIMSIDDKSYNDISIYEGDLYLKNRHDVIEKLCNAGGALFASCSLKKGQMRAMRAGLPAPSPYLTLVCSKLAGKVFPFDDDKILYGVLGSGQSTMAGTKGFIPSTFTFPSGWDSAKYAGRALMLAATGAKAQPNERITQRSNFANYFPYNHVDVTFTGFTDHIAGASNGYQHGLSPLSSFVRAMQDEAFDLIGRVPRFVVGNVAVGGLPHQAHLKAYSYGDYSEGYNPFNDAKIWVEKCKEYAEANGWRFVVAAVMVCGQEQDDDWSKQSVKDVLYGGDALSEKGMLAEYTDMISEITGQITPPQFIFPIIGSYKAPDSDDGVGTYGSMEAVFDGMIDGKLQISNPDYALGRSIYDGVVSSGYANDEQHFNAYGYLQRGVAGAKCAVNMLWGNRDWKPVYFTASRLNSTTIELTYTKDINFADSRLLDPASTAIYTNGNKGFVVINNLDSTPTYPALTITQPTANTIQIVCGETLASANNVRVSYALDGFGYKTAFLVSSAFVASERGQGTVAATVDIESPYYDAIPQVALPQRQTI